jgi:hypothetical protein
MYVQQVDRSSKSIQVHEEHYQTKPQDMHPREVR